MLEQRPSTRAVGITDGDRVRGQSVHSVPAGAGWGLGVSRGRGATMSRLDRHVGRVRNKLALELFLSALGATLAGLCGLLLLGVAVDRLTHVGVPRPWAWVWGGLGLAVVGAVAYAASRRPGPHAAAVAIDRQLGLAEKFSTALYARGAGASADPFAAAAVLDAERTAENVSLHRQFPTPVPATAYWAGGAFVALLLAVWLLPTLDLFGREARRGGRPVPGPRAGDQPRPGPGGDRQGGRVPAVGAERPAGGAGQGRGPAGVGPAGPGPRAGDRQRHEADAGVDRGQPGGHQAGAEVLRGLDRTNSCSTRSTPRPTTRARSPTPPATWPRATSPGR